MIFALLASHFVIGVMTVACGDRLGRRGFMVAGLAPLLTLVWLVGVSGGVIGGVPIEESFGWVSGLELSIDLRLDAFAVVMVGLVSGIGLLVCVYALSYFSPAGTATGRLGGLMTLFAGAMLGVVLTDHLVALFVFWELTSITSYLLIGNDDRDPRARDAALSAILITGAGGLVLLAGIVMIGQSAGTYRLSEVVVDPPSGGIVTAGLVCILIGAFTKSAQAPFSGWLPAAMVAPTPISAYLHAATMVKAGVYLIARLSPLFAEMGPWRLLIVCVGGVTMVIGGWKALRQHDLKLLLAFGTISQLGFMTLLLGVGDPDLAQAGVVLLIAHGAFKAALFMVVGIIDNQAGTRDVRRLSGFGPAWRPVLAVTVVSAASMAGLPPLLGFIAKEKSLDAAAHGSFGGALAVTLTIVAGSILTLAYSGRFVLGVFGRLGTPAARAADPVTTDPASPSVGFVAPAILLAAFTVTAGLAPVVIDDLVSAATQSLYPGSDVEHLALWHGFTVALGLSALVIAVGGAVVALHRPASIAQAAFHRLIAWVPSTERVFWAAVRGTTQGASRVTAVVQNGSLPLYLMVILGVAAAAPLIPAVGQLDVWPDLVDSPVHVPLAALIVGAALGATILQRRIAAALMLGAVGYAMAGFYVVQGAPDLALTQFAIETLATVLFVLVLRFLPLEFADGRGAVTAPVRLVVSALVGVSVFVLALVAADARGDVAASNVSQEMLTRSLPDAHGSNVVNVILVDFRGLDTLGEITVLVVAALGAVALARTTRRTAPAGKSGGEGTGFARLPVVDGMTRLLFPSIMVLSLYLLFAGHNQPGGGFVGGLTAGAAISLRYVAGGVTAVRTSFRLRPWTILGGGLLIAVGTAIIPLAAGRSVLEHSFWEQDLPVLGTLKMTTALPFDIGVYTVVIGLVLMAFEAFGDDVSVDEDGSSGGSDDPRADQVRESLAPVGGFRR